MAPAAPKARKHAPMAWECVPCGIWIWPKRSHCYRCQKPKLAKKSEIKYFKDSPKSPSNDSGNHGNSNNARKEIARLKAEKETFQKEPKSAKGDGAVSPDDDENVFSEKSSIATTTELEKDVQDLEDDFKLYQARLKLSPDCPRRQGGVECTKQQLEAKRKLLHDSRDPEDQIRNKAQRLKRIKAETETYRKQLREACLEEEAAEKKANELRAKILRHLEESEKLRSESRSLQLAGQEASSPPDMGKAIKAMQSSFHECFENPLLPLEVASKKADVEAAFVQMSTLLKELATFKLTIKTGMQTADTRAKEAATAATAAAAAATGTSTAASSASPAPVSSAPALAGSAAPPGSTFAIVPVAGQVAAINPSLRPPPPSLPPVQNVVSSTAGGSTDEAGREKPRQARAVRDRTEDELLHPQKYAKRDATVVESIEGMEL